MGKANTTDHDDQIIEAIGEWGPWQRKFIGILASITLFSAVPGLIIKFMSAPTDYWCSPPDDYSIGQSETESLGRPLAIEEWINSSSPIVTKAGKNVYDQCNIWNSTDFIKTDDNSTQACTQWTYDRSEWKNTIVQQWDLVCDQSIYKSHAQSAYFAGMLVGIFMAGWSSDRFGRKATLVPITVIMCLIGTIMPFMPNVIYFMVFRFIHGFFKIGVFTLVFVWSMEVVGNRWKTFIGIGLEFPWVISWLLLALLAYLLRDWQHLTLITSAPGLVYVVLFWYLPESPKWLLATGRVEEAEDIVRKAAEYNGRPVPYIWKLHAVQNESEHETKGNILDIFKHKNMAVKALILYFNWFANSFIYYGLTLNTGSLGGSLMFNFVLNGLLEIPAHVISLILLDKCGRKIPYCCMMAFAGIALFCTIIIPEDVFPNNWPIITLAMLGKLAITGTFGIIYVYSAELYPTTVRAVGIGSSSVFARFGGMVAPYVGQLDEVLGPTFPIAVYGVTGLTAALLALLLPETKTRKLPDTIEEGESAPISLRDGFCCSK